MRVGRRTTYTSEIFQIATEAGDVQVMSAGTGIRHAEYNQESTLTKIFQIWIHPRQNGGAPTWGAKPFPRGDRSGQFVALASGFPEDSAALPIRADARVLGATLASGGEIEYELGDNRKAYLVPASGSIEVNHMRINARDGAAINGETSLRIVALEDTEIVLVDTI